VPAELPANRTEKVCIELMFAMMVFVTFAIVVVPVQVFLNNHLSPAP